MKCPMSTAQIIMVDGRQAVELPEEFRLDAGSVSIRREGNAVILEPVGVDHWPDGFFEAIRIDDANWQRPAQGDLPPVPVLNKLA